MNRIPPADGKPSLPAWGRLSEQSSTIGQIIATVEDLAAQSKSARGQRGHRSGQAGEHGKGFGVVAQE